MGKAADSYLERLAMSEVTTFNWTIDQDLASYAGHGFPGIEIWLNKAARNGAPYDTLPVGELDAGTIDELAHDLEDAGLQAVSVVCAGGLTESDSPAWQERIAHLRFTVQFAAKIGASCVLVVPGDLQGTSRSASVERTASAIREGLADAHEYSIDLAIEPLRPVHTTSSTRYPKHWKSSPLSTILAAGSAWTPFKCGAAIEIATRSSTRSARPALTLKSCRWLIHESSLAPKKTDSCPAKGSYL